MKKKTKFMIAGTTIVTLAAAVGGTMMFTSATNKVEEGPAVPNTVAVERMDLSNKVSLSGTVKSADISTIKCSLSDMKVKSVNVKVGDEVKEGDVIAVLDDTDLQEKLAEAEKAYNKIKTKKELELSAADRTYESTINSAEKSVRDAEKEIKSAQKAYDEACEEDNKVYKEYLEALDAKNKAYDKFKPYEKKVKSENKADKEEKERDYKEASEKLTGLETELSSATEKMAQAESALKDAKKKVEEAREELSRQKTLRREAAENQKAFAAEDAEDEEAAAITEISNKTYDSTVGAADKMLLEAEIMLKDCQTAYDFASKEYNQVSNAYRKAADEKKQAYDKYKDYISNDGTEKGIELENKYKDACDKLEEKEKDLKAANKKVDSARDELNKQKELKQEAVEKSDKDRADIEGTYESTKLTANEDTETQKKEIKKIKENIEKCTIKATQDGVITSLSLNEGDTFLGGEVAVIQNGSEFIISANADQYEISGIEKGMMTRITVNALNNCEMEGTLTFAAPTPETKDSQGGQSINYPIESEILDPVEGLRLGMNAKLDIISEERIGVLAVPDECIQIGEDGDYYVEAVDEAGAVTRITVNYGMKSDYYSEIEGDGITEGMQVVMPEQQLDMDMDDLLLF